MQSEDYQILLKFVFAGKHGVGKTSLLTRESMNQFTKEWVATIGVDFRIKTYRVGNLNTKVQLWDTAGQERFRSIQRPYYKGNNFSEIEGAHAILLCFDLSDKDSFQNLAQELQEIRGLDTNICPIYLIGCKSDLEPKVFTDEILVFSEQNQCKYFQTSSKENEGVNECFQAIVQECTQRKLEEMAFSKIENKLEIKEKPMGPVKKTCC